MNGNDEFEQRPNVRWETDFGPATPMWRRYLLAALCLVLVLGFLVVAIVLLGDPPSARTETVDGLSIALFIAGLVLVVIIALFAERWAIRIRGFFEGGKGDPPKR